jgi:UDP-glucose 4-epimerase
VVSNWLITGGCGFIGTSLIKRILESNPAANIRILDSLLVGSREDLSEVCSYKELPANYLGVAPNKIELVVGDIRDENVCLSAAKGVEAIIHLAANTGVLPSVQDPKLDCITNVLGTLNLLEAARHNGVKKFIFASSGAPIGECEPPIHEEMAPHPVSPYGASKLAGEGYCSAYCRSYSIETICLRFGNVYGPRSKHKSSVVAKFIKRAIGGEKCEVYGDGSQTRDFIFIDDLISALVKAVESSCAGEVFQIASSKERSINEVVAGIKKKLEGVGVDMKVVEGEVQKGEVSRNFSDTRKAEKLLGWKSEMDFDIGLEKTIEYYLSN